ncbi:DUF2185 domain-containing protein [Bacillus sp. AFS041924]|uniref:DUF2185 domain-containing protein n=1 Tax=Bacillus sp. AFS041924 TaxID=2033503 RepID=UPI001C3F17BA|nr:DUF2185 domain-containing protein [Bacillus sp. AFS041924]
MAGFKKIEKNFYISKDKIKRLINSNEGCIASDRITVDGCKVGFMYREEPYQNGNPDSGWRFLAGDESDEYMINSDNHSVYQLNTICNFDHDIIPLLNSAPGTAYIRDENDELVLDDEWEVVEE